MMPGWIMFLCIGVDVLKTRKQEMQESWFTFCEEILPLVNRDWRNNVKRSGNLVSEVCTASDEAFAIKLLELKIREKDKKENEEIGKDHQKKHQILMFTSDERSKYYDLQLVIDEKRKEPTTGMGWDEAFRNYKNKIEENQDQGRVSMDPSEGFSDPEDEDAHPFRDVILEAI